jgi:hypothetical protein
VRFQAFLACCVNDWNEKFALLDRSDNLWANMRRISPVGTDNEIEEALADMREDIDVTRRMVKTDWPGLNDDAGEQEGDDDEDEGDADEESSSEEQTDAAGVLAQACKGKEKE